MRSEIRTSDAPSAPQILSQGIESEGIIFISGQIPQLPDGSLVIGDIKDQVHQVMKNLASIAKAGGSSLNNTVKVNIYVTDMAVARDINEIYPTYFKKLLPAREMVCVKELPLGAKIE